MKIRFENIAIFILTAVICCLPAGLAAGDLNQSILDMVKDFDRQITNSKKAKTDFIVVRSFFDQTAGKASRRSEEISDKVYQLFSDRYLGKTQLIVLNWKSEKPPDPKLLSKSKKIVYEQGSPEKRLIKNFGNGFMITGTISAGAGADTLAVRLVDINSGEVLMTSTTKIPPAVRKTLPPDQEDAEKVRTGFKKAPTEQEDTEHVAAVLQTTPSKDAGILKSVPVEQAHPSRQAAAADIATVVKTEPSEIKAASEVSKKDLLYEVIEGVNFKYEGQLKNGQKHGQGTLTFKNGDKYIGEWQNDQKHGQGTYEFAAGDKYVGQWKDDKMHGQGTYFFKSGNKYVGQWRNDKKHGQGIYYYKNGDKWEGTYVNNKKHGYGIYTWANGRSSKEYWQDGKLAK